MHLTETETEDSLSSTSSEIFLIDFGNKKLQQHKSTHSFFLFLLVVLPTDEIGERS